MDAALSAVCCRPGSPCSPFDRSQVGSEVESKPSSGPAPAARGGWAAIAAKAPPPVAPPSPKPVVSREASSKSVASSQPSSKADDRRGQGRVGRDREPGGKERPRDKEGRDRPRDREREGGGRGRVDRGDREDRGERGEGRRGEGRGEGRGQRGRRDGQPGWRGSDASVEQQMEDGAQDAPAKVQERVAPAPRAWSAAAAGNVVAVQAPSDRFRPQQGEPEPVRSAEAAAPAPTPAPTPAPAPAPAPEPTPAPASVAVPPAEPAPVAKAAPAPSEPQARAEPAPQPATPARAEPAPPAPARPEGGDAGQEQADEGEDAGAEEGGEGEEAELEEGEVELGYRRDMSWDGVVKSVLCYTAKELLSLQNGPLALLMPGKLSQILQGPMGKLSRTGGGVHSAPVRGGLPRNDSWKNRPSPRGGGPGGFGGMAGTPDGMWEDGRGGRRRGGRGGGGGGFDRNMGGFSGRWEAPQVQLHKSAQAFKLGQVRTDDPEEEARQKAFKSVLNKLTPENFERLTFKLLETPIPRKLTLEGLVDQIFDKALLEPTFSELYAKLCKAMQDSKCLPVFGADGEALPGVAEGAPTAARQQVYDFRKALLNKCQQEFEAGIKARNEHMQSLTRKDDAGETAEVSAFREGWRLLVDLREWLRVALCFAGMRRAPSQGTGWGVDLCPAHRLQRRCERGTAKGRYTTTPFSPAARRGAQADGGGELPRPQAHAWQHPVHRPPVPPRHAHREDDAHVLPDAAAERGEPGAGGRRGALQAHGHDRREGGHAQQPRGHERLLQAHPAAAGERGPREPHPVHAPGPHRAQVRRRRAQGAGSGEKGVVGRHTLAPLPIGPCPPGTPRLGRLASDAQLEVSPRGRSPCAGSGAGRCAARSRVPRRSTRSTRTPCGARWGAGRARRRGLGTGRAGVSGARVGATGLAGTLAGAGDSSTRRRWAASGGPRWATGSGIGASRAADRLRRCARGWGPGPWAPAVRTLGGRRRGRRPGRSRRC